VFSGKLPADLGLPPVDKEQDRIMLCGSPGLLTDYGDWFKRHDWLEGSANVKGQYVIEKAFVEK
jgi:ferredoxin--NADP+ reductase